MSGITNILKKKKKSKTIDTEQVKYRLIVRNRSYKV